MTILQSQDLFLVYKPETGIPSTLKSDGVDAALIDKSTGEIYNLSGVPNNTKLTVSSDEESYTSLGKELELDVKIRNGSIVNMTIVNRGSGFIADEIFVIEGGNATGRVLAVDDNGAVITTELYLNEGGEGYEVYNGLVTDFPFGHHSVLMDTVPPMEGGLSEGTFVDFLLVDGNVQSLATTGSQQKFPKDVTSLSTEFTVGDALHVLADKTRSGQHLDVVVASVEDPSSGGSAKFTVEQLKSDVQGWSAEITPTLNVTTELNDGVNKGGSLSYDDTTGNFTYIEADVTQSDNDVTLTEDFGFSYDNDGIATTEQITTQDKLNESLFRRVKFLEDNLYAPTSEDVINHSNPQLNDNTLARNSNATYKSYSEVATRDDLQTLQSMVTGFLNEIETLNDLIENIRTNDTYEGLQSIYDVGEDEADSDADPPAPIPDDPSDDTSDDTY